jgi:hypothetical protein
LTEHKISQKCYPGTCCNSAFRRVAIRLPKTANEINNNTNKYHKIKG